MGSSDDKNVPASTLARSFSAQLNDIFLLDDNLEQLNKEVEEKKLALSARNAELDALQARLDEAERRLAAKGLGDSDSNLDPTSPTSSEGSGFSSKRASRRRPIPNFNPEEAGEGAAGEPDSGGGSAADGASEPSKKVNPVALAPRALPANGGSKEANRFMVGGSGSGSEEEEEEYHAEEDKVQQRRGENHQLRGEEKKQHKETPAEKEYESSFREKQAVRERNDETRKFKPLTLHHDIRREDTVDSASSFGRTDSTKSAASTEASTLKSPSSAVSYTSTTPKITSPPPPLLSPHSTTTTTTTPAGAYTFPTNSTATSTPASGSVIPQYANITQSLASPKSPRGQYAFPPPRSPGHNPSPSAETIPIVFDEMPWIPPTSTMPVPSFLQKTKPSPLNHSIGPSSDEEETQKPPPPPKSLPGPPRHRPPQIPSSLALSQPSQPPQSPPPPPPTQQLQSKPMSIPAPLNLVSPNRPVSPYASKSADSNFSNGASSTIPANSAWSENSQDGSDSSNLQKQQEATTSPTQSSLQSRMENFSHISKEVGKGGFLKMKKSLTGLRKKAAADENPIPASRRSESEERHRENYPAKTEDLPPLPPLPSEPQQQQQQQLQAPLGPQDYPSDLGGSHQQSAPAHDKLSDAQKKLEQANKKAAEAFSKLSVKVRGFRRRRDEKGEDSSAHEPPLADWEKEEAPHVPKPRWPHLAVSLGRSNSFAGLRKKSEPSTPPVQTTQPPGDADSRPLPAIPPPTITIPRKPVPKRTKAAAEDESQVLESTLARPATSLDVDPTPQRPTTAESPSPQASALSPPAEIPRPRTSPEPSSLSIPPPLGPPPPLPGQEDDEEPRKSSSSSRADAISPQLPVRQSWLRSDKTTSTFMGDISFDSFDPSKFSTKKLSETAADKAAADTNKSSSSLAPPRKSTSNRESVSGRSETYSFLGDYYFDSSGTQLSPTKESTTSSHPDSSRTAKVAKTDAEADEEDEAEFDIASYEYDDEEDEVPEVAPAPTQMKFPPRVTSLSNPPPRGESRNSETTSLRTDSRVASLKEEASSLKRSLSSSTAGSPAPSSPVTATATLSRNTSTTSGRGTPARIRENDIDEEVDGVAPLSSSIKAGASSGTRSPYTSGGGSSLRSSASGFSDADTITTDITAASFTNMKQYNQAVATAVRVNRNEGASRGLGDGNRASAQVVDIVSHHGRPGAPGDPRVGPMLARSESTRSPMLARSDSRGRLPPFPVNRGGKNPAYERRAPPSHLANAPRPESPYGSNLPPRSSSRLGGPSTAPPSRQPTDTDWVPQIPPHSNENRMRSRSGPAPLSSSPSRFARPEGMPMMRRAQSPGPGPRGPGMYPPHRRAESPGPRSHSPGPRSHSPGPGRGGPPMPRYTNRSESPGPGPRYRREGPRERRGSTTSNVTDFSDRGGGGGRGGGMNIPMENVGMMPQKRYRPPQQFIGGGHHGPVPAGQHPPSTIVPGRGHGPPPSRDGAGRGDMPPDGRMPDGRMPGRDPLMMMDGGRMPG